MRELSYHPCLWFCLSVRDISGAWDRRGTVMLQVGSRGSVMCIVPETDKVGEQKGVVWCRVVEKEGEEC